MTDQPVASTGIAPTPDSVHDAGRNEALEAALAWADMTQNQKLRSVLSNSREVERHLAAAVRDLREQIVALNRECSRAIAENTDAYVAENIKLEAELAALKARTCQTCRHQYESDGWLVCRHLQLSCDTMANTCGAWQAREVPVVPKPEHVCGAAGYAPHLGDTCPACEAFRQAREGA